MPNRDTPCVGVCSTGSGDEVCRGCGRTWQEVAFWCEMTADEKAAVWERLNKEKEHGNTTPPDVA